MKSKLILLAGAISAGRADFLTSLMARHEQAAWMLRSHLETEVEETSLHQPLKIQKP